MLINSYGKYIPKPISSLFATAESSQLYLTLPKAASAVSSRGKPSPLVRFYSTSSRPVDMVSNLLNFFFVTGLTDAEGSFVCVIKKNPSSRLGWRVEVVFQIALHKKDLELLHLIKSYFGDIGTIAKSDKDMYAFRVTSIKQILIVILPHFDKFPLVTKKRADYILWKEIVLMMSRKEHLTIEGLQAILNIRASLNLGLSEELMAAFPDTIAVLRPVISDQVIPHPEWVAGFSTGEGCFFVKINKDRNRPGVGVQLVFQVAQHIRDEELMKSFVDFFKCGRYKIPSQREWGYFQCTKFAENYETIIEFFKNYPIRGVKHQDFLDWVIVAEMIKKGDHLTKEGSSKIIGIKAEMNTGRIPDNLD